VLKAPGHEEPRARTRRAVGSCSWIPSNLFRRRLWCISDLGGISTAVRGATTREAVGFMAGSPGEEDAEGTHEAEPFVVLGPSRRRGSRRPARARARPTVAARRTH
jgi:hypothetical protein